MSDLASFAHARRLFNAPLSEERAEALVATLAARAPGSVLDLGCGTAELLLRLCERTGAVGTGVDTDEAALAEARRRAERRGVSRVELRSEDARAALGRPGRWDALVSVGASHALGGFAAALAAAREALRPGGALLLGDAVWHRPPDHEYAALLEEAGPYPTLEARTRELDVRGWDVWSAESATLAEWDAFEDEFLSVAREWAARHPDARDAADVLARRERWNATYRALGRGVLGFGYFVATPR